MINLNIDQLIEAGIHIGHSLKNSPLFSSWMFFARRGKIWIINVLKSLEILKLVFKMIKSVIRNKSPIWFINHTPPFNIFTKLAANNCGEFYSTVYWIRGMISNILLFLVLFQKNLRYWVIRVGNLLKIMVVVGYFLDFLGQELFLFPVLLIILSYQRIQFFIYTINCRCWYKCTFSIYKITNTRQWRSLISVIFFNNLFSFFILRLKFKAVVLWFSTIKKPPILFVYWLNSIIKEGKISLKTKLNFGSPFLFQEDSRSFFNDSFNFFFSNNFWEKNSNINRTSFSFKISKNLLNEITSVFFFGGFRKLFCLSQIFLMSVIFRKKYGFVKNKSFKISKLFNSFEILKRIKKVFFFRSFLKGYWLLSKKKKKIFNLYVPGFLISCWNQKLINKVLFLRNIFSFNEKENIKLNLKKTLNLVRSLTSFRIRQNFFSLKKNKKNITDTFFCFFNRLVFRNIVLDKNYKVLNFYQKSVRLVNDDLKFQQKGVNILTFEKNISFKIKLKVKIGLLYFDDFIDFNQNLDNFWLLLSKIPKLVSHKIFVFRKFPMKVFGKNFLIEKDFFLDRREDIVKKIIKKRGEKK